MGGFKVATGSTGFLKANGTVDTTQYNVLGSLTTTLNQGYYVTFTNSSNATVGSLTFYYRVLGNIVYGMSLSGFVNNQYFPGTSTATKISISGVPSEYMPKGPIVLYAGYANGYDNMYGSSAWLTNNAFWMHGLTGAGVSTGMTGVNDDSKCYLVGEYFIKPQYLL
jgi:hypothetical protein